MPKSSNTLRALMVLAPNLATYTLACPFLIPAVAVSGINTVRTTIPAIRHPVPPATRVHVTNPEKTVPKITHADVLVRQDDTWNVRTADELADVDLSAVEISDSRLRTTDAGNGAMEWQVESPITFSYRVREATDVLDPENDALLFGHLAHDPVNLARAKARALKRVVVVDETVHGLYGERIEAYFEAHGVEMRLMVLPTTEEHKDMDMVLRIAEAIHDLGIDRRLDPVIAIGGGVCMDIVGFAASIYRRRTPYVRVPTTLMGYVDASIGAKSGVNFSGKKNKLGAYMPPALTLLDRQFLATLDERQLANGAAEIAKMALVKDPELFELLAEHGEALIEDKFQDPAGADQESDSAASRVLYLAIQTMLEELAPNLWEDSLSRLVDFGHVFSMELEMAALFDEKLFHGEAVAIDMAFSAVLAYVRGHIDDPTLTRILNMLSGLKLPTFHPSFDRAMADEAMYERIKFSQGQKIPLPVTAGASRLFDDITHDEMYAALDEWRLRCAA